MRSSENGRRSSGRQRDYPQKGAAVVERTQSRTRSRQRARESSTPTQAATAFDNRQITRPPCVFDLFLDLPHPAASSDSERARMIEPPELSNPAVLSEMYEPTALSRLARFAFPEHDDHQHALYLQSRQPAKRRNSLTNSIVKETNRNLNKLDIYMLGFKSERHTFSVLLSDGETRLYGHTLRYLPPHQHSKARSDTGRRAVRALILLTRAAGGERFYWAILKTIEAVMMQGDAMARASDMEDSSREKAIKLLHALHRRHTKKQSEVILRLRKGGEVNHMGLDDVVLTVSSIEYDVRKGPYLKDRSMMPGDFVKFDVPPSLQAGFLPGINPDDIDVPVMPLLRCLGPENTLRLLAALMCEVRVILVSESTARVAACVRAASSLLAQGNLVWRYNLVAVLPPHLLSCLADRDPYLVGLLDVFMGHVQILQNLKDVLCIHLDRNMIKTFGMTNPNQRIPDLTEKTAKESAGTVLFGDMQQILKAEERIWGGGEAKVAGEEHAAAETTPAARKKKTSKAKTSTPSVDTDIAGLFARVMRGDSLQQEKEEAEDFGVDISDRNLRLDTASGHLPRSSEATPIADLASLETFEICENERGEEGLRASLTSFFLVVHGELGAMLSHDKDGSFLLDRKKFLFTKKKQEGIKENNAIFRLYRQFSGSAMLEYHLGQRIEEFERGRSLLMPRHRTLFTLCEKHLRVKKIDFTFANIRKVISKTTSHSPFHSHVEATERARAKALTLTSAQPFDGNVSQALSSLMQDCHQCDGALPHTMAVVWSRLDDRRPNGWKHPLLGLHLLKNLLLHGPLTTASYALDGADKVRKLRFYSATKAEEHNKEVRESAKFVWGLIVDRPRLLLRREQVVASRAKLVDSRVATRWGSYLIKRLPFTSGFQEYHTLLRPRPGTVPSFLKQRSPVDGAQQDVKEMEIVRMTLMPRKEGESPALPTLQHEKNPSDVSVNPETTTNGRRSSDMTNGRRSSDLTNDRRYSDVSKGAPISRASSRDGLQIPRASGQRQHTPNYRKSPRGHRKTPNGRRASQANSILSGSMHSTASHSSKMSTQSRQARSVGMQENRGAYQPARHDRRAPSPGRNGDSRHYPTHVTSGRNGGNNRPSGQRGTMTRGSPSNGMPRNQSPRR